MGRYRTQAGVVEVDDDYAQSLGLEAVTDEENAVANTAAAMDARADERGLLGTINAAATSALSGATLGLSDVALGAMMDDDERATLRGDRNANQGVSTVANIVGGVVPAIAAPGSMLARTPAGVVSQWASRGVNAGRAAGGVAGAARVAAYSGAEAAAQTAGSYLSDVAIQDRELTAEGMAGALGRGFAFGSVAGSALYGVEKGTMAARRMFARTGSKTAAADAEVAWTNKSQEVLDAHDEMVNLARKRIEEAQQAQADLAAKRAGIDVELAQARAATATDGAKRSGLGGMPGTADDIVIDGATTTVRARDLADRNPSQLPGVGDDAVKMEKARQAIREGQRDPIRVTIDENGMIDVADGRHRLEAAIEADAPITVSWRKAAKREAPAEPQPFASATDDAPQKTTDAQGRAGLELDTGNGKKIFIPDAPPTAPAPPKLATLEEQLAEMQSRVNQGATIQDLNAERVTTPQQVADLEEALTEYATKREAVNAWVERIRNPRVQHHGINYEGVNNAQSSFGRVRRTFDTDVVVEQSGGQVRIIGAKENSLDSLTPNSRLYGADVVPDRELGRALDEEYHEALDMARTSASAEERAFALSRAAEIDDEIMNAARGQRPEVDAVIERIESLRKQHGRSSLTSAEKRMERLQDRYEQAGEKHFLPKPERQAPIPRAPTRKPDVPAEAIAKPPSTVDDAAEAAAVLGEAEKAAAKLADAAEAAGVPVPRAAAEARDGFRKAESEAERKATDRMVRAVDDQADGVATKGSKKPKQPKPPASPERQKLDALRAQKAQIDLEVAQAKKAEKSALADLKRAGPRPTVEAPPAAAAPETAGRFGALADMGAVLEAADTIGIPGLPRPSDLPVVGPLLGLYLKYRAVKAVAGRMTGRIPASGDAKAAALAAKTKDKALQAVDRALGLVERSAPTARNLAVRVGGRLADALSHSYHDTGEEKPAKDAPLPVLAAARVRELAAAANDPRAVIARVRAELGDVADPDLIAAAEQFELRKIAHLHQHAPKEPPPSPFTKREWRPSMPDAMKLARRAAVADDPIVAFEALEQKCITPDQADTLRTLYPKLFASCQERLIERSAEITESLPRDHRFRLGLLFDVPLDRLSEPANMAVLQSSSVVSSAPTTTSPTAPTQPPVPSLAGPVDLTALYTTPSDRRAARR